MKLSAARGVFTVIAVVLMVIFSAGTLLYAAMVGVAASEPENGALTGSAGVVSDVSASNGKAIKFGQAATGGFQANCIDLPSACGYPDATNTGVPAGTSLTNQSGALYVTQNGAVIDSINLNGQIIIQADNVTIKNSRITSGDYYPVDNNDGHTGLLVEDTEIVGTSEIVTAALSFDNYTALRLNVHGSADGLKANTNVTIEDCYVHDLAVGQTTHNDGVQTTGGNNVKVIHNTFYLSMGNVSSVIQMGNEVGPYTNWDIDSNLMDGGGWSINASQGGSTIVVNNNRFTRNAGYGPGGDAGMTWTNNYYDDDGSPVLN